MTTVPAPGPGGFGLIGLEERVRALASGRTNAEIASDLFVSLSTVNTQLAPVQAKIGARNRVEVAA